MSQDPRAVHEEACRVAGIETPEQLAAEARAEAEEALIGSLRRPVYIGCCDCVPTLGDCPF